MKNHLPFYFALLLLPLLTSCEGQGQINQSKNKINPLENILDPIAPVAKIDTIFTTNAPARITPKIRKNKEGNLLMAAFEEVILYNGMSFSILSKVPVFESVDAFDALEDTKGNIWIASTQYGFFRYDGKAVNYFKSPDSKF